MANNRVLYSILACGFSKDGETTAIPAHGVQSATLTTNFNLTDIFELSQAQVYQILEDLPDIQVTVNKVLDGYPLLTHLATNGATAGSIQGRSTKRTTFTMSLFMDTQENASGVPIIQTDCSGMFWNGSTFTFPVEGASTEEITLVGNNKVNRVSGFTFAGATLNGVFDGDDAPFYGTVMQRQHFDWNTSRVPTSVAGISSSGTNNRDSAGNFAAAVQNISVSFDLGRTNLNELGHKGPYFRNPNPIIDVTTTIDINSKSGDLVQATEAGIYGDGNNTINERIYLQCLESTTLDLGTRNKLQSVNVTGADTGGQIQTVSYTYIGKNVCTILHSSDPSNL